MNENTVVTSQRQIDNPLAYTYPCYKDMSDNNVIFAYKGIVTSDLVTHVLEMMGDRLEEDKTSKRLSKKFFNVMVECLTNVYGDETDPVRVKFDPSALLLVKREDQGYCVTTGHYVPNTKVNELKVILDAINKMDAAELKNYYQQILATESSAENGLSILAMVDLSRKSKHKLVYQFKYVTTEFTFFSLEARINNTSL